MNIMQIVDVFLYLFLGYYLQNVLPHEFGIKRPVYFLCTSEYWCSNMGFSCNGNAKIVVVKHNYNGGYLYSSYVHLSSYGNVSVGSVVSRDTIIGYMGTSGCSTGNHLHLEIATCHWKKGGCATYGAYERSVVNPANYINIPSSWNNR